MWSKISRINEKLFPRDFVAAYKQECKKAQIIMKYRNPKSEIKMKNWEKSLKFKKLFFIYRFFLKDLNYDFFSSSSINFNERREKK